MDNYIVKHQIIRSLTNQFEDIGEHRLVNGCLSGLWQGGKIYPSTYYTVDIPNCSILFNLSHGELYLQFKSLLISALPSAIDSPGEEIGTRRITNIISHFEYSDTKQTIVIAFNKDVVDYIAGSFKAGKFVCVDTKVALISSAKRYALAEYLQDNYWKIKKYGYFIVHVEDLKHILGMDGKYKQLVGFMKQFIQPTLDDLKRLRGDNIQVIKVRKNVIQFKGDING